MKKLLLLIGVFVFFMSTSLFSQTRKAINQSVNKTQIDKASADQQSLDTELDKQVVTSKKVSATSKEASRKRALNARLNREMKVTKEEEIKQ